MIDTVKNVLEKSDYICINPQDNFMESNDQFSIVDFGIIRVQHPNSNYNSAKCFYLITHPDIFGKVQNILSEEFNNLDIHPDEDNLICTPATAHCLYDYK